MKKILVRNLKTGKKMIQPRIPGHYTKNRDSRNVWLTPSYDTKQE